MSSANENKNKEKTEIKTEGINVKKEKKVIYLILAFEPFIFRSSLSEFFTSKNIIIKKKTSKSMLITNNISKFCSFKSIKLLPINVKKVKKPIDNVIIKINTINKFFFTKFNIV